MSSVLVDSSQCHLWTDALHARQLARDARNRWDRGTYVRMCVSTAWIAMEVACQDALQTTKIGNGFKRNLNQALEDQNCKPIDWSQGLWQRVISLLVLRNSYVHQFASLPQMFPESTVADQAVETVRQGIQDVYARAGADSPPWVEFDNSRGWDAPSNFGVHSVVACHPGVSVEDPGATRVFAVVRGEEKLVRVFPAGFDAAAEVQLLADTSSVPLDSIRVYEGTALTRDFIVRRR